VIGHKENKYRLPENFKFVQRRSEEILAINKFQHFRNSSLVWSEYSAWFENVHELNEGPITGVIHYRCAINTTRFNFSSLPMRYRIYFLKKLAAYVENRTNFILVGKPISTPKGMWQQYYDCEPGSISALELASEIYDEITDSIKGTTLHRLHTTNEFTIRNIFVTDTDFSKNWSVMALEIAKRLDEILVDQYNGRWGGFVLERIFSLYLQDYQKKHQTNLIRKNFLYFT
jgi:hypothetical protein